MLNNTINLLEDNPSSKKEDLSLFYSSKDIEKSHDLLGKKRNCIFKIEKSFENKSVLRNINSAEVRQIADKNNFSSTTNLSKESGKNLKKKTKKENHNKKMIREKNLFKFYSIDNFTNENKLKLNLKKTSDLTKKDFLKQINTKNNFITLNRHLTPDLNFAKINFTSPNINTDYSILNNNLYNNKFNFEENKQIIKRKSKEDLVEKDDYSTISKSKKNLFSNLSNKKTKNLSLFKNQNYFSNNNNLNQNYNRINKDYNFNQTANSKSLEYRNFTFLNLNLFEKSEVYTERIENIQIFLNKKSNEKSNDEKNKLLQLKNLIESNMEIREGLEFEEPLIDSNLDNSRKNTNELQEKSLKYLEENINEYDCVFSTCCNTFSSKLDWESHYKEHLEK